jgi:hypothetical protein
VAAGREDARGDEGSFAWERNPGRLHAHQQEEDDQPVVFDEMDHFTDRIGTASKGPE